MTSTYYSRLQKTMCSLEATDPGRCSDAYIYICINTDVLGNMDPSVVAPTRSDPQVLDSCREPKHGIEHFPSVSLRQALVHYHWAVCNQSQDLTSGMQ